MPAGATACCSAIFDASAKRKDKVKVLAFNCGSSTLKFQLVELPESSGHPQRLASGTIERIGPQGRVRFDIRGRKSTNQAAPVANHGEAACLILDRLREKGLAAANSLQAVGHRVVHGGAIFSDPVIIDEKVTGEMESLSYLAPLHNQPSLTVIHTARAILGPPVPQVAVFDTAFHRTIPEKSGRYAIPTVLADKYQIKRYGFHGLAHRYMTERYAALKTMPDGDTKIVTFHLGSGCSAAAIKNGRSIDTSMGFTPLEGLIMGTRSGDLDPSLISFFARQENADVTEVDEWLNFKSGLLGVSGLSGDMRELIKASTNGSSQASLAVDMFCYRASKYLGAYLVALEGAEAVVFGGGIGENSPEIRAGICQSLKWCGLIIDPDRNSRTIGIEGRISTDGSRIHAYVIPVDEEAIIIQDTASCLGFR